ncbi:MAG TPA: helix-turn-helix domain-containing protein [Rhizobacter sp.]|jgi:DNA-binding HxlR family transcriptional regulator|nr:helix-turn-helix domain-containing protein [Rhizobacter sp.]
MSTLRSYDDPCGIARALDCVGERWALLVVRELLFGPKRYTDLRAGLPSASPNVLSQRLRELEACHVLHKRVLPQPSGATVYELTAWGRELESVLQSLARWGSRAAMASAQDLSTDALLLALQTTFDAGTSPTMKARVQLRLGANVFQLLVERRRLTIERGEDKPFDVAINTDGACLRRVVFGQQTLDHARRAGELSLEGDETVATQFLRMFPRPQPVELTP